MSRDNQIEEMAKHCTYHHNGECFAVLKHPTGCDLMCEMFGLFANLEMAGYRKASDVAREIFEEIEEMLNMQAIIVCETRKTVMKVDEPPLSYMAMLDGRIYSIRVVEEHIAELKKKYTEDGE